MLSTLQIENIAVIERAEIEFGPGFNVLTGETGAGKSILIDAIHAVLGERTSRELIRTGCRQGRVTAEFTELPASLSKTLEEMGLAYEPEDALVIQRTLSSDGKSTARINGQAATASMLKELAGTLVNIHGQHDNQGLLQPECHYLYIDRQLPPSVFQAYAAAYDKMRAAAKAYKALDLDEGEKARQAELLSFQVKELEQAQLRPGEREELTARRTALRNSEKIAVAVQGAYQCLQGADELPGAVSLVQEAAEYIREGGRYLEPLSDHAGKLAELSYELADLASEINRAGEEAECNPAELEQIEERLDLLYRLSQKYGETEEDMLAYLEKAQKKLEGITLSEQRMAELGRQLEEAYHWVMKEGAALSAERKRAAKRFAEAVCRELSFLNMPHVEFLVDFQEKKPGRTGLDQIEFFISANPGEPPKPLAKIASGGELSRIMLAIKSVLASYDPVGTMIFDEIDTGISGSAAQKVGVKLRQTAKSAQVICVTHLAQIAALADRHLLIEKQVKAGRTFTSVEPLDHEGRKYELARIMGAVITESTLQSAEEMLHQTI